MTHTHVDPFDLDELHKLVSKLGHYRGYASVTWRSLEGDLMSYTYIRDDQDPTPKVSLTVVTNQLESEPDLVT